MTVSDARTREEWKGRRPHELFRLAARYPLLGEPLLAEGSAVLDVLDDRTRELAALRVSAVRDNAYVWSGHVYIALAGELLSRDEIVRVAAAPATFEDRDAAILAIVDDVLAERPIDDSVRDAVGEEDAQRIERTATLYDTVAFLMRDAPAEPAVEPVAGLETPARARFTYGGVDGETRARTLPDAIADVLWQVGVRHAFGVSGGAIAHVWASLLASQDGPRGIQTTHVRHESAAAYAATGAWAHGGQPAAVFVTTGPGLMNVVTGLETARAAGAHLVLVSARTRAAERGRRAIQETGTDGLSSPDLFLPGRLFDMTVLLESEDELPTLAARLAVGFAREEGYLAHVSVPFEPRPAPLRRALPAVPAMRVCAPAPPAAVADEVAGLLNAAPFAVWLGWGARRHAVAVRELLDRTGAPVIRSARAIGIADDHSQFAGGTGNGCHDHVARRLEEAGVQRILVLGSALGEATRGRPPDEIRPPEGGLIHVDLDPRVFGCGYPGCPTLGVRADVGALLAALLSCDRSLVRHVPVGTVPFARWPFHRRPAGAPPGAAARGIDPTALMDALQRVVVQPTQIPIWAEASSAMFLGARYLSFASPGRFLVENRIGAMGAATCAVLGTAAARQGTAVCLTGDGALLMNNEINTAATCKLPVVWVVLNDGGYGMVRHGMRSLDYHALSDAGDFKPVNFAELAKAMGADGVRVEDVADLDSALSAALQAAGPYVVDVVIEPEIPPPLRSLGATSHA